MDNGRNYSDVDGYAHSEREGETMTKLGKLKERVAYAVWRGRDSTGAREALHSAVSTQNAQESKMSFAKLQAKILSESPKAPRVSQPWIVPEGSDFVTVILPSKTVAYHGPLRDYWATTLAHLT